MRNFLAGLAAGALLFVTGTAVAGPRVSTWWRADVDGHGYEVRVFPVQLGGQKYLCVSYSNIRAASLQCDFGVTR